MESDTNGVYASGHVLTIRDGTLLATPFDETSRSIRGESQALAHDVAVSQVDARDHFSVSQNGTLAFLQGDFASRCQFTW